MKRQAIDDGGWFNPDRAEKFPENTRFDGRNRISMATGSQWEHECLYRTARGAWILNAWSQWQGSAETWRRITPAEAAVWLVAQKYCELPEELQGLTAEMEV